MGVRYSTTSISGYNATPPSDGGAVTEENRITWSKIKTKLPDPIKTALESMDSKLVTFVDVGPASRSATYTTVAGDHMKTLECSGTFTVSLMDATSATAGYTVEVNNQGSGTITVSRITSGDTINGTAGDVTITAKNSLTFRVNVAATGYDIIADAVPELAGLAKTDSNFIVGDGTAWVAESGATARTSLGLGTSATVNTGTSGATIPLLNGANTHSGATTFSSTVAISGAATLSSTLAVSGAATFSSTATVSSSDAGATVGPDLLLLRNSASPAANDLIGRVAFQGKNSAATTTIYGQVSGEIIDPTAASEDGRIALGTFVAGSFAERFYLGGGLYSRTATGGDKGDGTINAVAVYDDNVLLTDYQYDLRYDGHVRPEDEARWGSARLYDVEETEAFTREHRHLPTIPGRAEWVAGGPKSVGELVTALWATVEQLQMHIYDAHVRIKQLEAK